MRRLVVVGASVIMLLAAALTAQADVLPPGSIKALPSRAGAQSHLSVSASFDQPPGAELQAYNVDIARGFRFDTRAVSGRCSPAQARSATCPSGSQIGGGTGMVSISSASVPRTEFTIAIAFYLMRPQRPGDIAGLVLAGHEPKSGVKFALVGRLVRVAGPLYGLELRFGNTAHELPSGVQVQLHKVHVQVGARRRVQVHRGARTTSVTYSLLSNPGTCSTHGWPFRLTVSYSTGTEHYTTRAACRP